jgi:hypothetical protein
LTGACCTMASIASRCCAASGGCTQLGVVAALATAFLRAVLPEPLQPRRRAHPLAGGWTGGAGAAFETMDCSRAHCVTILVTTGACSRGSSLSKRTRRVLGSGAICCCFPALPGCLPPSPLAPWPPSAEQKLACCPSAYEEDEWPHLKRTAKTKNPEAVLSQQGNVV